MHRVHQVRLIAALVFASFSIVIATARADEPAWKTTAEHWYALELAGAKAGWMCAREEKLGEQLRTTNITRLSIGRGTTTTTAEITTSFVETAGGKPVMMKYSQQMSAQLIETSWTFSDDSILQQTSQGGQTTEKRLPPIEGEWLTPRQASERLRSGVRQGDTRIEYTMLDGASGVNPVNVQHVRIGQRTLEIDGRPIAVTEWNTTSSALPVVALDRYDEQGVLASQNIELGIGMMMAERTTKAKALQAGEGDGPELLVASFVTPSKPIERLNQIKKLELRLRMKDGSELPSIPTAGAQRVMPGEDGSSALVTIMPAVIDAVGAEAVDARGDLPEYLQSSAMVSAEDDVVSELAERSVRSVPADAMARAEAMRAFVHDHISSKGLEVAFATAAETARSRKGDCSEHAVLLCAMLRAQQIPARVVTGLVYADTFAGQRDLFGWHMWTQAWIDDRWIDFDPTLSRRFHAGHIMIGASSLADGVTDAEFSSLILVLGKLEIDVMNVEYARALQPSGAR